jgi:hypothetical protein
VGTKGQRTYCRSFCDHWHHACQSAYVALNAKTGALQWCAQDSAAVVCAQLNSVAQNGTELCELAGVVRLPVLRYFSDALTLAEAAAVGTCIFPRALCPS